MRAGRKKNQSRRGVVLALAAVLAWTAAAPVAAGPLVGRIGRPLEGPVLGAWKQAEGWLGWLTAVWAAETDPPPADPPPPPPPPNDPPPDKQGHTIDPDGG
ncbi:MAG TPA: hypothetical protein VEG34_03640 [Thermoanaerobaculia bacterium]|nr:hypothetical protein [Thermoanaerobaculia bacterium]